MDFSSLISVDKVSHCLDLRIVLIAMDDYVSYTIEGRIRWGDTYGLVSWLSNGLTSLPVNMLARTRYLRTCILCCDPASS